MNIIKLLNFLYKAKDQHYLSVTKDQWNRWKVLIKFVILCNKNYKYCTIYRKKYKFHTNIVVVGLKWSGKNTKRRTSGFAKEFLQTNKDAKCIYCECDLTPENATTDHIVPISKGGNNSQINLLVVCFECNNERADLEFKEYLKLKNPRYKNLRVPYV